MATHMKRQGGKQETPFYTLPENVRTSSQIIDEARRSLRAVPIARPYTPAGDGRHLFSGGIRGRKGSLTDRRPSRPPSVFSMGPGKYSEEIPPSNQFISRPTSKQRLSPIDNDDDPTPVTPGPSLVNISHSTQSLPSSSSLNINSSSNNDTIMIPELKTSHSSPTTSKRIIKSAERQRQTHSSPPLSPLSHRPTNNGVTNNKRKKEHDKNGLNHHKDIPNGSSSSNGTERRPISNDSNGTTIEKRPTSLKSSKSQIAHIWDTQVTPLLSQLDPSNSDTVHLCALCTDIWNILERNGLFGKAPGPKRRNSLLQAIFKLLGHKDPRLLLKLARLILAMQVTGSNLLNVFKLVFSLSRDEVNDKLFYEVDITDPLITALSTTDPHTQYDAIVYGIGAIKLLVSNDQIREVFSANGKCIQMMSECIKKCSEVNKEIPVENKKHIADVLIQLIGALRNLSDTSSTYDQLTTHSIVQSLATVMEQYSHNTELIFNLSRLLSKLTLSEQCRLTVSATPLYLSLLPTALATHVKNEEIVLRVCFILDNISRDSTDISVTLCHTHDLVSSLNQVLLLYGGTNTNSSKATDVLIKCVSLIANLSVHQSIADIINTSKDEESTISHLLNILESSVLVEELTVNTLVALNNLSFYSHDGMLSHQNRIIDILVDFLSPNSHRVMLEATRVLGNLTRQSTVRNIISMKRVDELLVTLLDSKHIELVYAVCGVLVNLMMDRGDSIGVLKDSNGVKKLLDVLSHFGRQDWLLASLVCKVLWNYSEGLADVRYSFTDEETVIMSHLLEDYLDPVTAFTNFMIEEEEEEEEEREGEDTNSTQQFWAPDFVPVASDILQKLKDYPNKVT